MNASVEFLLGNLKQLVQHHADFIRGAENDLQQLNGELEALNALLKDATRRRLEKDEAFMELERNVREVVYDLEDVIDICVSLARAANNKSKQDSIIRCFKGCRSTNLAEAVQIIRAEKVRPLFRQAQVDFAKLDKGITDEEESTPLRPKKKINVVGFKEETDKFIDLLNEKSDQELRILSIVGMAGLGKTTLAWNIFNHPTIKFEFPIRIWITVSDYLNMKNVLLTILKEFIADAKEESTPEMITKVKEQLMHGKFLIVMDDVWTLDAWQQIKEILPMENRNGRILVTTRHKDVAARASLMDMIHQLRFLTSDESWELLQYEVYGKLHVVPKELMRVGKYIVDNCNGIPLSVVVIGGLLSQTKARGLAKVIEWKNISKSMQIYLVNYEERSKTLPSIIALSYQKLPYKLRNSFLYIGVFPEDADIPVNKLIRLWIAEGLIHIVGKGLSLEQVAYDNLKDLINRNLVMVKKAKIDGEPTVCQIHDSVREFCKMEASKLNLFQEMSQGDERSKLSNSVTQCRRICIHSHVLEFFRKREKLPNVRSFLYFHESTMNVDISDVFFITSCFVLLRVYDAKSIRFSKFPRKLMELVHLRYLTLVMDQCESLPEDISDLWNLQTLIVDISSHTLKMEADIWKMRQLRHFKTKASIILRKDGRGEGGDNLQTLSRLSPESCTDDVFRKARKLITLGVQGDLNKITSYDCFGTLELLNKLKLVHQGADGEGPLRCLPNPRCFPPRLKILVLCSTYLDWSNMNVLAMVHSLEVLKLKDNAFTGRRWVAEYVDGFPHLNQLIIERASELVDWTATGDPFPKLRFLVLNNCSNLVEVPSAVIGKSLELMSLKHVTAGVVSSAKNIQENLKREETRAFKLEIAASDVNH